MMLIISVLNIFKNYNLEEILKIELVGPLVILAIIIYYIVKRTQKGTSIVNFVEKSVGHLTVKQKTELIKGFNSERNKIFIIQYLVISLVFIWSILIFVFSFKKAQDRTIIEIKPLQVKISGILIDTNDNNKGISDAIVYPANKIGGFDITNSAGEFILDLAIPKDSLVNLNFQKEKKVIHSETIPITASELELGKIRCGFKYLVVYNFLVKGKLVYGNDLIPVPDGLYSIKINNTEFIVNNSEFSKEIKVFQKYDKGAKFMLTIKSDKFNTYNEKKYFGKGVREYIKLKTKKP